MLNVQEGVSNSPLTIYDTSGVFKQPQLPLSTPIPTPTGTSVPRNNSMGINVKERNDVPLFVVGGGPGPGP